MKSFIILIFLITNICSLNIYLKCQSCKYDIYNYECIKCSNMTHSDCLTLYNQTSICEFKKRTIKEMSNCNGVYQALLCWACSPQDDSYCHIGPSYSYCSMCQGVCADCGSSAICCPIGKQAKCNCYGPNNSAQCFCT